MDAIAYYFKLLMVSCLIKCTRRAYVKILNKLGLFKREISESHVGEHWKKSVQQTHKIEIPS